MPSHRAAKPRPTPRPKRTTQPGPVLRRRGALRWAGLRWGGRRCGWRGDDDVRRGEAAGAARPDVRGRAFPADVRVAMILRLARSHIVPMDPISHSRGAVLDLHD